MKNGVLDGGEREGGSHMYTCMYEGMHMLGEIDKGGEREMRIKGKEEGRVRGKGGVRD